MQVKDVMTKSLVIASTDTPVQSVAELMAKDDIGALPVRKGAALVGIVTDRDIVVRALAKALPFSTPVGDIMTTGLVTCRDTDDVSRVAKMMKERKIRRVVVLDEQEHPAGVVSLGDIAAHGQVQLAAETLQKVSEPVHSA
ncbi:MAG: CBS domain-containing protein [Endomicrobiales bacterium]